jgi:hypothetical protein
MLTETAYAVPLSSGITVFVQPLTIYEIRLMQAQVKTVYPDPLPKDFKSLVAGTTDIYDWNAEQQAEFAKAELTAARNRQRWIEDYMCVRSIVGA